MTPSGTQVGVLFVCLGNICRSPMAKGVFLHQARQRGLLDRFHVDSCGTGGWHAGNGADPRTLLVAARNGVQIEHVARQLNAANDFTRFDLLLAMDAKNRADLLALGAPEDRVRLLRSFDASLTGAPDRELNVPDPYYGGDEGFQHVFDMIDRANAGLLNHLTRT